MTADGSGVFRKKLVAPSAYRVPELSFQGALLRWRLRYIPLLGREIGKLGLEARLIPPVYVTPFVKRQKTDAEAIAGAALRPTMRYVSVKSAAQQAQSAGHSLSDTESICPPTLSVGKCLAGSFWQNTVRRRTGKGSVQTSHGQF